MRLSKHPINSKGLIGIDKPIAHLESLLHQESKDVRVIGILGMGGIGKTTIAEVTSRKLCAEYEGCCFLANVRVESRRHGIIYLKEKLFCTLFAEDVKINTPNGLSNDIERRIGRMKVLIVLDDVTKSDQIEKLYGSHDWFGPGSRMIVTTRDKQVFIANKVDDIYQVGVLSDSEALELFNLNAFKQFHGEIMEYYELSRRVVNYSKGIPLVLKVLGHLLRGKDKEVWGSQLDILKKMPRKKVHDVMKLSYDDLDRKEQENFLDLACFFSGLILIVGFIKILLTDHESDNSVAVGLERLKDKALITISEDNVVSMHDILQEMAWEIVRQESSEDPRSFNRVRDSNYLCDLLKNSKGIEAIRSITKQTELLASRKLKLSPHIFAKMSKLHFLDIDTEHCKECLGRLPQGLQSLPTELRYLRWMNYPLKSLPVKFSAEKFVILDLPCSEVEKLWDGVRNLVNLKEVKLSGSYLKELPDFSKSANLEVLKISSCPRLTKVHTSIFSLYKLEELYLHGCTSLTKLTSNSHLSSLKILDLGFCLYLREFSVTSENMKILNLESTRVNALPSSFGRQRKLEILTLGSGDIKSLPSCIKNHTRLRYLSVDYCRKLQTLPELPPSLETLLAGGCTSLLFLATADEQFKENRKNVKFWNCLNLDEHSLISIELNAQINVMKLTYQHLSAPEQDYVENYDDCNDHLDFYQATYVYPRSRVPEWLEYKMSKDYIIVDQSSAPCSPPLGFCFIVGHLRFGRMKFNTTFISDGDGEEGEKDSVEMCMSIVDHTKLDHVCVNLRGVFGIELHWFIYF